MNNFALIRIKLLPYEPLLQDSWLVAKDLSYEEALNTAASMNIHHWSDYVIIDMSKPEPYRGK